MPPYHPPCFFKGQQFDLGHLDPITFKTPSEKLKRDIVTWCRFTTHTYSRSPEERESGPFIFDEGKRPRIFCTKRYALSLHLPSAISQLAEPTRYVWETAAERSWLHQAEVTLAIDDAAVAYQMFFAVKKAARADPYDVEMTVESAYARELAPKLRGRMMIAGVLTAAVEGRKPHTQGGRKKH